MTLDPKTVIICKIGSLSKEVYFARVIATRWHLRVEDGVSTWVHKGYVFIPGIGYRWIPESYVVQPVSA